MTIPSTIKSSLETLQQTLAQSRADVTWITSAQLHITLKFLDEISEAQRQAIEQSMRQLAAERCPFSVALDRLGVFPSLRAARIVWVGIGQGRDELIRLATALEQAGVVLGLRKEPREFSAHITIGRVRSSRGLPGLIEQLQRIVWEPPAPWIVETLTLYQSVLTSAGPQYSVLAEVPLIGD